MPEDNFFAGVGFNALSLSSSSHYASHCWEQAWFKFGFRPKAAALANANCILLNNQCNTHNHVITTPNKLMKILHKFVTFIVNTIIYIIWKYWLKYILAKFDWTYCTCSNVVYQIITNLHCSNLLRRAGLIIMFCLQCISTIYFFKFWA